MRTTLPTISLSTPNSSFLFTFGATDPIGSKNLL